MSTVFDPMKANISLHGLGFIQVQLQGGQRLHVWHPDLPRRTCFEHSAIHSHRFDFTSLVLVGTQINIDYADIPEGTYHNVKPSHVLYLHEGPRSANGGRPWTPDGKVFMTDLERTEIEAGCSYQMKAYRFHRTEPGGDGKVATLLTKGWEGQKGSHSSCPIGVEPDTDFDRFQLSPAQLWTYVFEVLGADSQVVGERGETRTAAARDVLAERQRQICVEGYSVRHDDHHTLGELALAAALYAIPYDAKKGGEPLLADDEIAALDLALQLSCGWQLKPEPDARKRLIKAGALILAEIERLDRMPSGSPAGQNLQQQEVDQ